MIRRLSLARLLPKVTREFNVNFYVKWETGGWVQLRSDKVCGLLLVFVMWKHSEVPCLVACNSLTTRLKREKNLATSKSAYSLDVMIFLFPCS